VSTNSFPHPRHVSTSFFPWNVIPATTCCDIEGNHRLPSTKAKPSGQSFRCRTDRTSFNHTCTIGPSQVRSLARGSPAYCTSYSKSISFNSLPFFQLRRPGEFVDRRSTAPVLVPGLALVFERRVRHVARPLLNSDRCGPSAPPWAPIYRGPHSLVASEAFAVQTRRMGLNLVYPPLFAPATLPEPLFHDRPWLLSSLIITPQFTGSQSNTNSAPLFRRYATKNETQPSIVAATLGGRVGGSK